MESVKLTPAGNRGYMDRLFWIPGGRPLLIEFKVPGEEPEPLQAYRIERLREIGYDVEVHTTADGAVAAVCRALESAQVPAPRRKVPRGARVRRAVPRARAR